MSGSLFKPENALEEEMLYAVESHDEQKLHASLAIADVYLPSKDDAPEIPEERSAREGDEFPLPIIDGPDGVSYIAAYSSLNQLVRAEGSIAYRRIRGRDLARIAPRELGLAVNPAGDLGFPLSPEQLAALVELPPPDDGETGYLLGEPKEEPVELLDAMHRVAESCDGVRAVYRALLVRSPGATPECLVGFELETGVDPQAVIDAAFAMCGERGILRAGFLPIQPGIDSGPVGAFMLERTKPFWIEPRGN
ncbi:MAG TPA: enhanced serine sensitivity protein SseB C-terminal domain-containing protein [Gaiellaceae bacterium]|jgi:hypothetical protein|nr:enhanced serine sensitivity protein SseB C-terminal domain-containing protein [Gaiellaceae bacterium]